MLSISGLRSTPLVQHATPSALHLRAQAPQIAPVSVPNVAFSSRLAIGAASAASVLVLRRERRARAKVGLAAQAAEAEDDDWLVLNWQFLPSIAPADGFDIWPQVLSPVLFQFVLSFSIVFFHLPTMGDAPTTSFNILGVLVSLVTVFRTSRCYERYWQGRTHLGLMMAGLVDTAGSVGALFETGESTDQKWRATAKSEVARHLRLYMREACGFLRFASINTKVRSEYWRDAKDVEDEIREYLSEKGVDAADSNSHPDATPEESLALDEVTPRVRPALVLQWLRVAMQRSAQEVDSTGKALVAGDNMGDRLRLHSSDAAHSLGLLQTQFNGCAKIASTPLPPTYVRIGRVLRFALVYSAPFFFAEKLGYNVVPICTLLAFGYHGIDAAAGQLSDPFLGKLGDAALDGRFVAATCGDIDALLLRPPLDVSPNNHQTLAASGLPSIAQK